MLQRGMPGYLVWVFRSRAKCCFNIYPDLDIAIITCASLSQDRGMVLSSDLSKFELLWMVDVVGWLLLGDYQGGACSALCVA